MRWLDKFALIAFVLMGCLLASCHGRRSGEEILARVNGLDIQLKDYMNLYETMKPKDIQLLGNERQQMRNLILQTLVRRAVILTNAEELDIQLDEKEFLDGVEKFKQGYPESIFQETLFEGMVDENEWKEQIRQSLLIEKLFLASEANIEKPSIEESMQYYQDNPRQFKRGATARSLHIAVGDEELALEIRKQLRRDPKRFRELAKEHSMGPEAQDDALIEVEKGLMPESIDRTLFSAPLKTVSKVVKSPYGFHIFYILKRSPAVNLDFEQVKTEIRTRLQEERKRRWIEKFEEELIRSAEIEYNRELIKNL